MTPSERVKLLKELFLPLTAEGFSNVELVFDSFGIPSTSEDWPGGKIEDLVRERLRKASDDALLSLAAHYETPNGRGRPPPYRGPSVRLPMAVCAAVAEVLRGSHTTLNALFEAAGAPGPPPDLSHATKWKTWLHRAGNDPSVDSLALVGNLIEEFMDLPPQDSSVLEDVFGISHDPVAEYKKRRERLSSVLEEHGFRYFRGGRIFPNDSVPPLEPAKAARARRPSGPTKPAKVEEMVEILVKGIPRAMHPLTHRRKGLRSLTLDSEYDIQDLLHSQLRPWVADIRPEEFTPSYAGSSARMDFLLPAHRLVIEMKRVRDKQHAKKVGEELIVDIEHYRMHPKCQSLWCVVYDPLCLIQNPSGLVGDLEGERSSKDDTVLVRVFVFPT